MARIVVSAVPHHVTQRGNRRQTVFFGDEDYRAYVALLRDSTRKTGVAVWAWCLMPNHVHLILVPPAADALRAALSETHRRYSRRVNFREGWRGYLCQGRFASCPTDEGHTLMAARYAGLNPVRVRPASVPPIGAGSWRRGSTSMRWRPSGAASAPAGRWERRSVRRLETATGRAPAPRRRGPRPARDQSGDIGDLV